MTTINLDFEVKSEIDLPTYGLDIYSSHPSTKVILCAFAFDGDTDPELWDYEEGKPFPRDVLRALADPNVFKKAFNAQFERIIARRVLKVDSPYKNWRCTMALAYQMSFSGGLGDVGAQMGLPQDAKKDAYGKKLIKLFCCPQRTTKKQPHRWLSALTNPDQWEEFRGYCRQDVVAEMEIERRLSRYEIPEDEWRLYELDQKINDNGLPVDMQYVENALWMAAQRKQELIAEMTDVTGLANPNSGAQMLPWLRSRGYPFNDLQKDTVKKVLKENAADDGGFLSEDAVAALNLRRNATRTSIAKYDAFKVASGACPISEEPRPARFRFAFQFAGASRTQRWAGRRVQAQNLPRTPRLIEDLHNLAMTTDLIRRGDYEGLSLMVGEPMEALVGCIRSAIRAPRGRVLRVCDLSSIETCVIAWLANCERLLKVIRAGYDAYKDFAVILYKGVYADFGTPEYEAAYAAVTKGERTDSKPAVLGCFAADTEVLTKRGWVRIIEVKRDDLVFDGVAWVAHDGVVDQGVKQVIDLDGITCTPDHKILTSAGWMPAQCVAQDESLLQSALSLGSGKFSTSCGSSGKESSPTSTAAAVPAGECRTSRHVTQKTGKPSRASYARTGESTPRTRLSQLCSVSTAGLLSAWRTVSTLFERVASAAPAPTSGMPGAGSSAGFPALPLSFNTASAFSALIAKTLRSIGLRTAATTSQETFASSPGKSRTGTRKTQTQSGTSGTGTTWSIFTGFFALATVTPRQWLEKLDAVCQQKRSSAISATAGVRTFDILNAGPRSRFVVRAKSGQVIAHNCGYRLGGGDLIHGKRTGLWGYAENMGIDLPKEDAHRAVSAYREGYPEVPVLWRQYEDAIAKCLKSGQNVSVGPITFQYNKPFLEAWLPSGRALRYFRPELQKKTFTKVVGYEADGTEVTESWTKTSFTYMGQDQVSKKWVRIFSHGGKMVENFVQAIARDVLKYGLLDADAEGFFIAGHVHDEIITEQDEDDSIHTEALLGECMTRPREWAEGLPLGYGGWENPFYMK